MAAAAFLEGDDGCVVDVPSRTVKLSQILKWYSVDFGNNKEEVHGLVFYSYIVKKNWHLFYDNYVDIR